MQNIVTYVLGLQSTQFQGALGNATASVGKLEGALASAKSMLGTLGVGFAIFQGAAFVKSGVEAMHDLEQSIAQVKAGLESTKGVAGLTFKDVEESAKGLAKALPYSRKEILDMQAQLLTFPAITKDVFTQSSQAILDMASRTHRGTNELAIMLGKALQDPTRGITAMRRIGVNFNDQQTEMVKSMVATNRMGEAQKLILQELSLEFAGSAKAAADADPLFQYNKIMGSIKLEVGAAAMALLHELTPSLVTFANALKSSIEFIKQHKDGLIAMGKALVAAYTSMKLLSVGEAIYKALARAALTSSGAFETLGIAIGKSLGPIGLAAVAIGALVGAYSLLNDAEEKRDRLKEKRAVSNDALASQEALRVDALIAEGRKAGISKDKIVNDEYARVSALKKANLDQLNTPLSKSLLYKPDKFDEDTRIKNIEVKNAEYDAMLRAIPKENNIGTSKSAAVKALTNKSKTANTGAPKFDKAQGQKSITINVSIKDLIGTYNSTVTNVQGNATKIKEAVLGALTGAVNDFQIVAGQ